jgi:Flp pilus assembly pilin Flp
VMLIAILLIAIVTVIGHQTNSLFSNVSNALPK